MTSALVEQTSPFRGGVLKTDRGAKPSHGGGIFHNTFPGRGFTNRAARGGASSREGRIALSTCRLLGIKK